MTSKPYFLTLVRIKLLNGDRCQSALLPLICSQRYDHTLRRTIMSKTKSTNRKGEFRTVISKDGTNISFLSVGTGPGVMVLPSVRSMASDYAVFASALADNFAGHTPGAPRSRRNWRTSRRLRHSKGN